jgi:23S rRNA (adenine2503-C2)-methyltransferase
MLLKTPGNAEKTDILSMEQSELEQVMSALGEKGYRALQLFSGLHKNFEIDSISNLPKSLREKLGENFAIPSVRLSKKQISADGTVKYLFELGDKNCIESVLMRYRHGATLCISTQAGCRMGCAFCASGMNGLARNLNPSEILLQIEMAQRDSGGRVDGVVMMGTGEPLDNFDASVAFIRLVSSPHSFNIGQRHITLSTSGLVDKIYALAEHKFAITLSISLHAPNDELRSELMPVNRRYRIGELVEAASAYQQKTGRRVTYEYAMISGKNDSAENAKQLASLLSGRGAHVNLIRLNKVGGSPFEPSPAGTVTQFAKILEGSGINVTLRRRLGADIDGACGQLRRGFLE